MDEEEDEIVLGQPPPRQINQKNKMKVEQDKDDMVQDRKAAVGQLGLDHLGQNTSMVDYESFTKNLNENVDDSYEPQDHPEFIGGPSGLEIPKASML